MMAARETLDESMATLLTESQQATWKEKTTWGRRGDGDRGRRGDRGGRRGGRDNGAGTE
jgi:hypothetical protein